jgi:hypothetical protein
MTRRRTLVRWTLSICAALVLLVSGWMALAAGFAHAESTLGPPADASCAALGRVDWTATNGPQWGRTLLPGHGAPGGWFGVDVCGNGVNAYAPGGANLSCDHAPANFHATGCAPGGATYDGFGLTFQCVELVVRFSAWAFGDQPSAWRGNAPDLWSSGNHPADFTAIRNGASQSPMPGDIVVWGAVDPSGRPWPAGPGGNHDGHVAVVAAVHGSQVLIVEENALWGATNMPSETLPLAHNRAGWTLGKSVTLYGWLHSSKNTGRFDGHGAVRGTPSGPPNQSANSSTGLPSLAPAVVVTSAGTLADLTWTSLSPAERTAGASTDTAQITAPSAPRAAARSLGAPPGVRLAPLQTPAALIAPTGGRDVYALGMDGRLYAAHSAPALLGVAWQALGSPLGVRLVGAVAASPLPGGIAIGAIGSDGSFWWRAGPAGNLGGWTALGHPAQTLLTGAPVVAGMPGSGLPLALARGQDGHLYESHWTSGTPDSGISGSGAAAPSGWDGWVPVSLPAQAGLLQDPIVPIFELSTAHDHIGAWADTPLDLGVMDAHGALWLLRRTGASTAWRPYSIAGAVGIETVLGGVAVAALAGSAATATSVMHLYVARTQGTALVSLRVDQSGELAAPDWTPVAPALPSAPSATPGSSLALGADLSLLVASRDQRVMLAGTAPALALVAPADAAASGDTAASAAPSWAPAGAAPGPDSFADPFQSPTLDPRWLLEASSNGARLSAGGVALEPAAAPGRTLLLEGAPAGDLQMTVQVTLPAFAAGTTQAGVVLYLDDGDWLSLGVGRSGGASFCPVAWGKTFPCQSIPVPGAALAHGVYLRVERYGSVFTGLVSADGVRWSLVGSWRPVWPQSSAAGTTAPTPPNTASPSPTLAAAGGPAPTPAASPDVAPLAFTGAGLYAQSSADTALSASVSGWPTFLDFSLAAASGAGSAASNRPPPK